ncbi:2-methoxy-6-polyprenyl-1,4-benzoquinol methylase, mitochondrial [Deinococcus xinjiangensis]|uniref:2-methoxy-6-polyprenyl-1,4-benzoquinol methylase, mitochondrial n=1 Tax=Deinococcus xinjiangensis TaxID=457454 RepID=A0ABP9V9G0_9DEIO
MRLPNRLTRAQRSNFWGLTAWGYAFWRSRSLSLLSGGAFSLAREERLFLGLCQPQAGQRWLDMGSSTGFYAGALARRGCRVDALDLSPSMLHEAARREPYPQIRWHILNAEDTGLEVASYDGVTVGATLNETAHPAELLREAERLLRPRGQLWLMYVAHSGGWGQRLLAQLGGLTFPDLTWIERQVPSLRLKHAVRFGRVEFALLQKESA